MDALEGSQGRVDSGDEIFDFINDFGISGVRHGDGDDDGFVIMEVGIFSSTGLGVPGLLQQKEVPSIIGGGDCSFPKQRTISLAYRGTDNPG